ncbi:hypothetical protein DS745_20130 [Anaerobacillus alkaliphilus]|uniref:Uncharacterized protein n=1 Tax=Anaerobacillus alkaliphilus TaxID=1548597 RepID=A0A4Q0VQ59_9BACI|nr:hypothetical protein [Anaerobacillus alkaliphilus]RXI98626.1 hypothetical protein DS745_20130 [Anaerobacillus alkaliphilus]
MRAIFRLCLLVLFFFSQVDQVFAHKMFIEPVKEGTVKVQYEDGSFSKRTVVYVYDEKGNEIQKGALDDKGYFYFDPLQAKVLNASDGIGHYTEWQVGETMNGKSLYSRWASAIVVLLCCLVIALLFSSRSKKKKQHHLA